MLDAERMVGCGFCALGWRAFEEDRRLGGAQPHQHVISFAPNGTVHCMACDERGYLGGKEFVAGKRSRLP